MKRILALFAMLALLISFVACGEAEDGSKADESAQSSESSGVLDVDSSSSDASSDEGSLDSGDGETSLPDEGVDEQKESNALSILGGEWCDYEVTDDYEFIASASVGTLTLGGEDRERYPELLKTLDGWNAENLAEGKLMLGELAEESEYYFGVNGYYEEFWYTAENYVARADKKLLSVRLSVLGCAETYFAEDACLNLDPETGKEVKLSDVVTDTSKLPSLISEAVCRVYEGEVEPDYVDSQLAKYSEVEYEWTLGYRELTFYFHGSSFMSGGNGRFVVALSLADNEGLVREEYLEAPAAGYAIVLPEQTVYADVTAGEGALDEIHAALEYDGTFYITFNDCFFVDEEFFAYDSTAYLVTPDNESFYVYVDAVSDNDYRTLYVYKLGNAVERIAALSGDGFARELYSDFAEAGYYRTILNDLSSFEMTTRINTLGTMIGRRAYYVDKENGLPVPKFDYYKLPDEQPPLVTKVELEALDLSQNETVALPAGTELRFLRGDNESYVDMADEAGNEYRIGFELEDWQIYVGGYYEEDCFDGIMYAG